MNLDYFFILISLIISLSFSLIVSLASLVLSEKTPDKEKVSVYECGFDPFHTPGEPFSIRFFLIAILFLVFDLEITFLFPWSAVSGFINLRGQLAVTLFIVVLVVGLIYE